MIKEKYEEAFKMFLLQNIDFSKYDMELDNANLHFNQSKTFIQNINSKYYKLINNYYIDNLNEEDKNYIASTNSIDEKVIDIVRRTYKEVIKAKYGDKITYGNPPVFVGTNGNLALILSYGKTNLSNETFLDVLQKQNEKTLLLNKKLKEEIKEKLEIDCDIFIYKSL